MDTARGTLKVDAIAAVVKELATERSQLHEETMTMQGRMMGMMNRGSGQAGTSSPMENCPMMKGLAQGVPQGDQDTHHPENQK
jgi:hypothetical protein